MTKQVCIEGFDEYMNLVLTMQMKFESKAKQWFLGSHVVIMNLLFRF